MDESTRAGRLFAIRAALGEGVRKPLSLREMARQLTERAPAGRKYHASQLSGWETGATAPTLDDVALIASLDPLHRGAAWLAFGNDEAGGQRAQPPAIPAGPLLPARTAQVLRADDESPATKARRARTRRAEGS